MGHVRPVFRRSPSSRRRALLAVCRGRLSRVSVWVLGPAILVTVFVIVTTITLFAAGFGSPRLSYRIEPLPLTVKPDEARAAVRAAFLHAWSSYRDHAWGRDLLCPVSGRAIDGPIKGEFILASLDTLLLLRETEEVTRVRTWLVATSFSDLLTRPSARTGVRVSDVAQRVVGPLLSAYRVTQDQVYLDKAREAAGLLAPAFATPTGLPRPEFRDGLPTGNVTTLRDLAGFLLEWRYLDLLSHTGAFGATADLVIATVATAVDQLPVTRVDVTTGAFVGGIHALDQDADGLLQVLAKHALLVSGGGVVPTMFDSLLTRAATSKDMQLWQRSTPSALSYVTSRGPDGALRNIMDSSVCSVPAAVALRAAALPDFPPALMRLRFQPSTLLNTCLELHRRSESGLAAAQYHFPEDPKRDFRPATDPAGRVADLSPATFESLFVLWRLSADDPTHQQWTWELFEAVERNCRAPFGYAMLERADQRSVMQSDLPTPHLMAGTFKFMFLTFVPDAVLSLQRHVFTTRGHILEVLGDV